MTNRATANQLVPIANVTRLLGYHDARNFRQSVAPRIGLSVIQVGLRWFAHENDVQDVMNSLNQAAKKGGNK
jgi:hypothetical protein